MIFKQFDIDYNKVTIEGVSINKPKFIGVKDWLDFWDLFDGEAVEEQKTKAYDEGFSQSEREHEDEIEDIKKFSDRELKHLTSEFENLVNNIDLTTEDRIASFKESIDSLRDAIWRL